MRPRQSVFWVDPVKRLIILRNSCIYGELQRNDDEFQALMHNN